ncbi:hypothetical protein LNTAR_19182 [Lentisphaera araneosa HTCC2155]|jgi:hypothetical protein|uniref:Uncharacterized protein n=1 Tax=Lentisphaera araneosa HTCC2155 TaxID=313628 RepID=A6DQQ1_9BACT|nr:hypothetical protein [Lentisphaera araneosa]EDM25288.1 hypothetical protein LNTAR_24953 [Lentisphaera araneosa HTCC2155]EDM25951.1 hypothetical protein LNTAR_19177 [Lentisphaera araneosa HTCC2155]EDM25952.1 hypothetical protein LNTAR_19182 [Lentisphaera araneosa HTCC2155]
MKFKAIDITFSEDITDDIVQLYISSQYEVQGDLEYNYPYINLSRNYEFPNSPATIQWYDSNDKEHHGSNSITEIIISRDCILIKLNDGEIIEIYIDTSYEIYLKLQTYIQTIINGHGKLIIK